MAVSRVFLMLLIYTIGNAWALFFPKRSWVVGTRLELLAPVFNFINPGPFSIKEVINLAFLKAITYSLQHLFQHVVASLIAPPPGVGGSTAVLNFAVQRVSWVSRSST